MTAPANDAWGTRTISLAEAERFASGLAISTQDRISVARTLYEFQPDAMVRGMFFGAIRHALARAVGDAEAMRIEREQGIGERLIPFSLYPHRDYYRLWFAAIPHTHPGRPMAHGIERIAEGTFPVFLSSAAGRGVSMLPEATPPELVLERLEQAYNVGVPHNEHKLELLGDGRARWRAIVEPSPFYPETLIGILRGAMRVRGGTTLRVNGERVGSHGRHHQRLVFELDWT